MKKLNVQINEEATGASVTYMNEQKDKLMVVFHYNKNAYYEYAEAPNGNPTMYSKGVELIADIYTQPHKKGLFAKINPQYDEPVLKISACTWVKKTGFDYGETTVEKDDEINLWKNLKDLTFRNINNKSVAEFLLRAQKDVIDERDNWERQQYAKKRKSFLKSLQSPKEEENSYQQILRFLQNQRQ